MKKALKILLIVFLSAGNVILRDFLTPEKCAEIIELNRTKGALPYID